MRFILILVISLSMYASEFPIIFSSAGDEVYKSMHRYEYIKDLEIYQDRPELLEAYCLDASEAMKKGFALDKIIDDPEQSIDKKMMKSYAKELRILSNKNEEITAQLDIAVGRMIQKNEYSNLRKVHDAGFHLGEDVMLKIKAYEKSKEIQKDIEILEARSKSRAQEEALPAKTVVEVQRQKLTTQVLVKEKQADTHIQRNVEMSSSAVQITDVAKIKEPLSLAPFVEVRKIEEVPIKEAEPEVKELSVLQRYKQGLKNLKEELYLAREEENLEKTACLNDVTAINYWIIKVLENDNDSCAKASAIRQMKSYDKSSAQSCGRSTLRYIEWHGRIKPYVGKELFEAEASCQP
ncbi:hypothetical protein JHD50_00570 [Sulfurimonas sp. MAG313]|nr:hypothetical protein [Sulfurimonas sp. MAG313]MDF1879807.1 hypothetical protein [Sulfurimonas sp. MAG313]